MNRGTMHERGEPMLNEIREFGASSGAPDSVLVAEDDPVFRLLFQRWLEQWGYKVSLAEDGEAAWRQLQSDHRPRLLLLDWMMPGMDGVEVCRRVRAVQHESYSYILVLTAKTNKEDTVFALDAGADDYITKPVDPNELRARIQVGRRILHLQDELVRSREQLRLQATHDALTGLSNRRCVIQSLNDELARAERTGRAVGVLMLDLDHFKQVNDLHGHQAGDAVLAEVAGRMVSVLRTYDKVGRYGGEEFLIVLPDCSEELLGCIAERVRARVAAKPVVTADAEIPITVSVGGAVNGTEAGSSAGIIRVADSALYRAKHQGRNCCVIRSAHLAASAG
jgi:diguanylate cyclase (GGDEF)-like protein